MQCAKAMWSAGAPVPTISRCVLSTLDRYIEARAEAAPVLSHVTAGRMRRLLGYLTATKMRSSQYYALEARRREPDS